MRLIVVLLLAFIVSCEGTIKLTPIGHRLYYKGLGGQLSCYTNRCCFPYKEKLMICTQPSMNDVMITVEFVPEK